MLFTPQDRITWQRPMREGLGYAPGEADEHFSVDELELPETAVAYRARVWECLDRLRIRGKSLQRARETYEYARQGILDAFDRDRVCLAREGLDLQTLEPSGEKLYYDLETASLEGSEELYRNLDFDRWLCALKTYVARGGPEPDINSIREPPGLSVEEKYVSECYEPERFMGFLGADLAMLLTCLLSVVDPEEIVELDISELVINGYLGDGEEIARVEPYFTVLTEGNSDKWILERSLTILYPHLASHYRFADFEASGLLGGIPNNIQVIKTFIALSIRDQLIVLFDNDAAGIGAMLKLAESHSIPSNVRIMALPDLPRARSHPTLGPEGLRYADVNRQAVSIEFFLGDSILEKQGGPPPVRWKSFQADTGLYQGEIEGKTSLQRDFNKMLADPTLAAAHDWTDMRFLLESIFTAFE